MRIFTILTLLMISSIGYSQLVLVNSPAELAGSYTFGTTVDNGTGTPWNSPSVDTSLTEVWTGDLVLMNDEMDPNSDGCTASSEDYTGKICLIDRGACNFSLKIYNAENAGAIAAVILNNNPGEGASLNMLGGDFADVVTIPGVFLSYEDGVLLKDAVANGPVNMSIGAIVFNNDLSITDNSVKIPFTSTIEASQVGTSGNFPFLPVSRITNTGLNDATGITANCAITNTVTSEVVYDESIALDLLKIKSDSIVEFPEYDLVDNSIATYAVQYTISSDSIDGLTNDNSTIANFSVKEGVYSRASWDNVNDRPNAPLSTTIDADQNGDNDPGPKIEFLQGITFPEAGLRINKVSLLVGTDQPSLAGEQLIVTLKKWNDADENSTITDESELQLIGAASYDFANNATNSEWIEFTLDDASTGESFVEISEAGSRYFFTVKYLGVNGVNFGFDTNYDLNFDISGPWTAVDFPYIYTNDFPDGSNGDITQLGRFGDFGATLAVGYYVDQMVATRDFEELKATVNLFPNPSASELFADVTLENRTDELRYFIVDMNGKILRSAFDGNVKEITKRFDVSGLASGNYNLLIVDGDKAQTKSFVVGK